MIAGQVTFCLYHETEVTAELINDEILPGNPLL